MSEPRPIVDELLGDARGVASDLLRLLELKSRLAEEEIRQDVYSTRRLAVVAGIGTVATLVGLPLLLMAACLSLDGRWGVSAAQWAMILSFPLVIGGLLATIAGWSRFRRDFLGLRESAREIQEDLRWLRDWLR